MNGYLATLIRTCDQRGLATHDICEQAGICYETALNERGFYDGEQLGVVVHEIAKIDSFLGQMPRNYPPGQFALMCEFIIYSETLGIALDRGARFYNVMDQPLRVKLSTEGDIARLEFEFLSKQADTEHLLKEWWPRMWHRLSCWLIGKSIPVNKVSFVHSARFDISDYEIVFNAACEFRAQKNFIEFDAKFLNQSIIRDPEEIADYLESNIDLTNLPDTRSMLHVKIRYALRNYFIDNQDFPPIDRIASECCISSQTLRRRLKEVNTSYSDIKDSIRRELVSSYLAHSDMPIAEVACRCGFAEPSGLSRAVKLWFGVAPRAYRLQQSDGQQKQGRNL